jgi:hypothetical protein
MPKTKNRRRHLRHVWRGVATYRGSLPVQGNRFEEISGEGDLTNLSEGGLGMLTDERLTQRQFLAITIPLSRHRLSVPTLAYVQWSRPVQGEDRYISGLSFLV